MRNGRVVFRGGAGMSDLATDSEAHSGTVYRLASVAKAVTGTLAYDLEQDGLINLDARTNTIVPGLGSRHTHTVRQLLQNSGCVKHYVGDDSDTQILYPSAQAALNGHLGGAIKTNSWIFSGCAPPTWNYSTHGFTIAAAALEIRAGTTFANLIQTRIAGPLGLDTLRAEIRASPDASGELATVYGSDGVTKVSNRSFENVSWKAGGSGIESSALDLALFGDGVLRNRYFPKATRDRMWSGGTSNGQANGWSIDSSKLNVNKGGDNQGSDSHIRIDVANGITVVALTNTNPPSVESKVLTQQLLTIAQANP